MTIPNTRSLDPGSCDCFTDSTLGEYFFLTTQQANLRYFPKFKDGYPKQKAIFEAGDTFSKAHLFGVPIR